MLRLTQLQHGSRPPMVKAEGRLVGEWAGLLEAECARLAGEFQTVDLDLAAVIDVDARGLEALRRLRRGRITLVGCTPILLALLAEEETLS